MSYDHLAQYCVECERVLGDRKGWTKGTHGVREWMAAVVEAMEPPLEAHVIDQLLERYECGDTAIEACYMLY